MLSVNVIIWLIQIWKENKEDRWTFLQVARMQIGFKFCGIWHFVGFFSSQKLISKCLSHILWGEVRSGIWGETIIN